MLIDSKRSAGEVRNPGKKTVRISGVQTTI